MVFSSGCVCVRGFQPAAHTHMKVEHPHGKRCEAGEPTFPGFLFVPTWPRGCLQLSEGVAAKPGFEGWITEEYLEFLV